MVAGASFGLGVPGNNDAGFGRGPRTGYAVGSRSRACRWASLVAD